MWISSIQRNDSHYIDFSRQFGPSFFSLPSYKPSLSHAHLPVGMHPSRRLVCRSLSRGGGTSFTFSYREERTTWSPDGKMRSQALSAAGHKPSLDQPLKTRIFTEERSGTLGGPIVHRRRPHETLQEAVEAAAAIRARQAKAVHTKIKAVDHKGVNWRCPHAGCAASFANQDALARHQLNCLHRLSPETISQSSPTDTTSTAPHPPQPPSYEDEKVGTALQPGDTLRSTIPLVVTRTSESTTAEISQSDKKGTEVHVVPPTAKECTVSALPSLENEATGHVESKCSACEGASTQGVCSAFEATGPPRSTASEGQSSPTSTTDATTVSATPEGGTRANTASMDPERCLANMQWKKLLKVLKSPPHYPCKPMSQGQENMPVNQSPTSDSPSFRVVKLDVGKKKPQRIEQRPDNLEDGLALPQNHPDGMCMESLQLKENIASTLLEMNPTMEVVGSQKPPKESQGSSTAVEHPSANESDSSNSKPPPCTSRHSRRTSAAALCRSTAAAASLLVLWTVCGWIDWKHVELEGHYGPVDGNAIIAKDGVEDVHAESEKKVSKVTGVLQKTIGGIILASLPLVHHALGAL